jgi:nucleoside 2-deoxyribosyltransferase
VAPGAETQTAELAESVDRADFVIGVLDPKRHNDNVYYELGYARALGKQVRTYSPAAW